MTGRCTDMDAARGPLRGLRLLRSPRLLCVVAGLLCTVGVVSGAVLRASDAAHHRHPVAAAAASTTGHLTSLRDDLPLVVTSAAAPSHQPMLFDAWTAAATGTDAAAIDSVRTRGPPASV
jgi:hypothetical protein